MRIFIAFPVVPAIAAEAADVQLALRKKYPTLAAKWVAPRSMHITLEFLGAINERQLEVVRQILIEQAAKAAPFFYAVTGVAVWPNSERPETIVLTVAEVELAFSVLMRKAVHEALTLHNLSHDFKLWRPHVTLARVTTPTKSPLKDVASMSIEPQVWRVPYVALVQSHLTTRGATYIVLQKFPLG